jgi:hypothetical protein
MEVKQLKKECQHGISSQGLKRRISLRDPMSKEEVMNFIEIDLYERGARVARLYSFKPKITIWVNFELSCNERCL